MRREHHHREFDTYPALRNEKSCFPFLQYVLGVLTGVGLTYLF